MVLFICITIWLLLGFSGTYLFFLASRQPDMSLCFVITFSLFGVIMWAIALMEWALNGNCIHQDFFKRKHK